MAHLLVRSNFKTAKKYSTKLQTTFPQYVLNHNVNFQSQLTTDVEMPVACNKECV